MQKKLLAELKAAIDGEHVEVFDVELMPEWGAVKVIACWFLAEGPEVFGVLFTNYGRDYEIDYMDTNDMSSGHAHDIAIEARPYIATALAWWRRCQEMADELNARATKAARHSEPS